MLLSNDYFNMISIEFNHYEENRNVLIIAPQTFQQLVSHKCFFNELTTHVSSYRGHACSYFHVYDISTCVSPCQCKTIHVQIQKSRDVEQLHAVILIVITVFLLLNNCLGFFSLDALSIGTSSFFGGRTGTGTGDGVDESSESGGNVFK